MDYSRILNQILSTVPVQFQTLTIQDWEYKERADRWSKKEILGHLVDSAVNNHRRIVEAIGATQYTFDGYNQVTWVSINHYQQREVDEIIKTFHWINLQFSLVIERIPPEDLEREVHEHNFDKICMRPWNKSEPVSLSYLIWDYIYHLEHHLTQVHPHYTRILSDFK